MRRIIFSILLTLIIGSVQAAKVSVKVIALFADKAWFVSGTEPGGAPGSKKIVRIRKPGRGLMLAMDPRIPDEHEYFEFALTDVDNIRNVRWYINNELIATTNKPLYNWKISRGKFSTRAEVTFDNSETIVTQEIEYRVN